MAEQLSQSAVEAEEMAKSLSRPIRVIGWYHSHPHITVEPSHVDVRTQHDYQLLDSGFLGLIFSCFTKAGSGESGDRFRVIAFQSLDTHRPEAAPRPAPEEALALAKRTGMRYQCLEVPLTIVPTYDVVPEAKQAQRVVARCLRSIVGLQRTLWLEEKAAYEHACQIAPSKEGKEGKDSSSVAGVHPLTAMHHSDVYRKSLLKLLEHQNWEVLRSFEQAQQTNLAALAELKSRKQALQAQLQHLQEQRDSHVVGKKRKHE